MMEPTEEQKKFWAWMEFFKPSEFDSPDEIGSGYKMETELLRALKSLRIALNMPLRINSGYRTESWNIRVGGEENSAHTRGWAVDIVAEGCRDRFLIDQEARKLGFTRIGIGNSFIHLDMDKSLPQNVLWLYVK